LERRAHGNDNKLLPPLLVCRNHIRDLFLVVAFHVCLSIYLLPFYLLFMLLFFFVSLLPFLLLFSSSSIVFTHTEHIHTNKKKQNKTKSKRTKRSQKPKIKIQIEIFKNKNKEITMTSNKGTQNRKWNRNIDRRTKTKERINEKGPNGKRKKL